MYAKRIIVVRLLFLQYLGEMDEEGVASVQEEESTYTLPLLYIPESVLFPGQILPYSLQPMYSSHVCEFE